MAGIVAGIASSHTPQLSSGVGFWPDHAERDRRNPQLLGTDAEYHTYEELLATADPSLAGELTPAVWDAKYGRCQDAIGVLRARLAAAQPDVAVIIGDDQRELFRDDGIPAFACFLGDELADLPPAPADLARIPQGIRAAMWAAHAPQPQTHPACPELSAHLAESLTAAGFDLLTFSRQATGRSLGHAFTFPRYRLGLPASTLVTPLFVNTYYPPNVPSAARCHDLGAAVRAAVHSWPAAARVAVIATGGLSHFVVDTALDRRVLTAIEQDDPGALRSLTRRQLRSGTSEILNWIVAAGALAGQPATVVDYVPGYRTPAGTGAGMAFAHWG